ncbi:MAG: hypothetical protein ABI716_00440 [Candidatus Saccharibacteria bacterium]
MILLKATTETLALTTSSVADIDYSISYADITTTTFLPSTSEGKIVTATTTTALAAPAASTQRQIKLISFTNRHALTTNTIRVMKVISGTQYYLTPLATLLAGETMQYIDGQGWLYYTSTGSLKVDGTTAAGSTTQVQFNDAGLMAGDPGLTYDKTNDILRLNTVNSAVQIAGDFTAATTPPAGTLSIFARQIANRMMIAQVGPSGLDSALQPLLARNKVGYWNPPGNATTVPGVFGITALTANGTATTRTIATTTLATRMRRIGYPSTAIAGTFAGARLAQAQFSCGSGSPDGSGFMVIERWVESDPAVVSGRRAFHGMTATTGAFTNVEVNTLLNNVGICQLSTDATQWYWQNAGSSAQVATAVGTSVGAPGGNSTTAWELAIFAPNGVANTYYLQLTNITTGATATNTVSGAAAVCPQSTMLLSWNAWATNNATGAITGIDMCSLYVETDT